MFLLFRKLTTFTFTIFAAAGSAAKVGVGND